MDDFFEYSKLYPNLLLEICKYFTLESKNGKAIHKNLMGFCGYYKKSYNTKELPQPYVVARVCQKLIENSQLSLMKIGGNADIDNEYLSTLWPQIENNKSLQEGWKKKYNCIIYGFKYIFEEYKEYVRPIIHTNIDNDISIGTCFLYMGGIVTAKHCIENAKSIAIKGIEKNILKNSVYAIHEDENIDIVFIKPISYLDNTAYFSEDAEILDQVITMGYPNIAGFHNFLTVEEATVSSRLTTSVGQIVSKPKQIWMKKELFLITAKIKGGNSGGPVINNKGSIVGISVNISHGKGSNYDDLGYGTVIPISIVKIIIEDQVKHYYDIGAIEFNEFIE